MCTFYNARAPSRRVNSIMCKTNLRPHFVKCAQNIAIHLGQYTVSLAIFSHIRLIFFDFVLK